MLIYILIGVLAVIGIFLVIVATCPANFRIVRTGTIAAPPATVFAQVNDFHKWEAWSPWDKIDPAMKRIYEGAPSGTGAIYRWVGNKNVGEGGMTITESRPSELIRIKLEFLKPFKATNETVFTFTPQSNQTVVTWDMTGTNNFMGKLMTMFMNMDKMVGGQFEKGLAEMKTIAEKS